MLQFFLKASLITLFFPFILIHPFLLFPLCFITLLRRFGKTKTNVLVLNESTDASSYLVNDEPLQQFLQAFGLSGGSGNTKSNVSFYFQDHSSVIPELATASTSTRVTLWSQTHRVSWAGSLGVNKQLQCPELIKKTRQPWSELSHSCRPLIYWYDIIIMFNTD